MIIHPIRILILRILTLRSTKKPIPKWMDSSHSDLGFSPCDHVTQLHQAAVMDSLPGKAWDFPGRFPRASKSRSMALRSTTLVSPKGSASGS